VPNWPLSMTSRSRRREDREKMRRIREERSSEERRYGVWEINSAEANPPFHLPGGLRGAEGRQGRCNRMRGRIPRGRMQSVRIQVGVETRKDLRDKRTSRMLRDSTRSSLMIGSRQERQRERERERDVGATSPIRTVDMVIIRKYILN